MTAIMILSVTAAELVDVTTTSSVVSTFLTTCTRVSSSLSNSSFRSNAPIADEGEWAEAMVGRTWVVVAVGMDGILGVRWSLSL